MLIRDRGIEESMGSTYVLCEVGGKILPDKWDRPLLWTGGGAEHIAGSRRRQICPMGKKKGDGRSGFPLIVAGEGQSLRSYCSEEREKGRRRSGSYFCFWRRGERREELRRIMRKKREVGGRLSLSLGDHRTEERQGLLAGIKGGG